MNLSPAYYRTRTALRDEVASHAIQVQALGHRVRAHGSLEQAATLHSAARTLCSVASQIGGLTPELRLFFDNDTDIQPERPHAGAAAAGEPCGS